MESARRRPPLHLLAALAALAILRPGPADAASSTVSGEAYGVTLNAPLVTLTKFPGVVLAPQGGSASASAANVIATGILTTGAVTVSTQGTTAPSNANAQSTASIAQLNVLAGLVQADGVNATASSTCNGTSATSSTAGSGFVNLVVAGIGQPANPPPNTVIAVAGGTVTLNEQTTGGNGLSTSSLTVNMIHVHVNVLLVGTIDIVLASAHSDVACGVPAPSPTPTPGTCVPGANGTPAPGAPIVSGEGYDVFVAAPPVAVAKNPHVVLAPSGGALSAALLGVNVPGTITSGSLTTNTNGTTSPSTASSDTMSSVENLNVLAGLVTADLAEALSSSSCNGAGAASNDAGTQFVNLVVNGTPIAGTPPPNSTITVPGVATIKLNEQIPAGNGVTTSALTINLIHVVLAGGGGEIIVASAHSDVDCAPASIPVPTCTAPPTATATPTATPTPTLTATPDPTATTTPPPGATATATPVATITFTPLPTATTTATTTPTPAPTADGDLNHFLCYEIHLQPLSIYNVAVTDMFGAGTVTLKKGKRICLPSDKRDEDPTAPGDPGHLTGYTVKRTGAPFVRARGITVTNQFGSTTLDVTKPDRLLVPTAKNLAGPPGPPNNFVLDHFMCYRVAYARQQVNDLKLEDQFGLLHQNIKKPTHLCIPSDKNGEGIPVPGQALMCYKVRTTPGTTPPPRVLPDIVFAENQFGAVNYPVYGPRELCVPSLLTP